MEPEYRDVFTRVLFFLDVIDRCRVSIVCKRWKDACNNPSFWKPILTRFVKQINVDSHHEEVSATVDSIIEKGVISRHL